jgi:hypothetical protein
LQTAQNTRFYLKNASSYSIRPETAARPFESGLVEKTARPSGRIKFDMKVGGGLK